MTQETKMKEKIELGKSVLRELFNAEAIDKIVADLDAKKPGYSDYMFYSYGHFYGDETLDLKTKELIVVAALVTQKGAHLQLKGHITGCKNIGMSKQQVTAAIVHLTMYIGFPSVVNALLVLNEVYNNG